AAMTTIIFPVNDFKNHSRLLHIPLTTAQFYIHRRGLWQNPKRCLKSEKAARSPTVKKLP
ncbi:MAG: hypothetical protein AAB281_01975, partial [Actinomycetota bacterium]